MPANPAKRAARRLAAWRSQLAEAEAAGLDPREARKEIRRHRAAGTKFGQLDPRQDDRRQQERRNTSGTPQDLEARMRAAGINDDRRVGQRRTGNDRRR